MAPSSNSEDSMIKVFIVGGAVHGCSFTIKGNTASVGRDFSNDVQLDDQSVSRKHAIVYREGGGYCIEDLSAKNGTRINGQAIVPNRKVRVNEGVPIVIGNVLISLGKCCSESTLLVQHPSRAGSIEEPLFNHRVVKYKQALKSIQGLCSSFLETLDVKKICEGALDAIFSSLKGADTGYILLTEAQGGGLREIAALPRHVSRSQGMTHGGELVEQAIRNGRTLIVTAPGPEPPLSNSILNMGVKSALCVPMICKFGTMGAILVQSTTLKPGFCKEDLFFVNSLTAPLTLAIGAALLHEKMNNAEKTLIITQDDLEIAVRERTAELEKSKAEMEKLSTTDEMTGLSNYRYFMRTLESEFTRAIRYGRMLSLLMIDIDCFKNLNDTYGHLCGDSVIKKVAELSNRVVRSTDVVARYGGDELGVILPETTKESAFQVAEKLKGAIEGFRFEWTGKSVEASISIGLATGPAPGIDSSIDLLNAADRALYQAKRAGRNMVVDFESIQRAAKRA